MQGTILGSSAVLENLDGLVKVRDVDEFVKVFWAQSSGQRLLAVDTEDELFVICYGPVSKTLEQAIQNAIQM